MASREQQRKPKVLRVIYKCRRCLEIHGGRSGGFQIVSAGLVHLTVTPWTGYGPRGSGHMITMLDMHHCEDGGLGMSDLLGADPND